MRLLSGLVNPDLCHELDSDPLGTVEVGEGWTEERREALGAVGRWSEMSRLIIDSNCVIVQLCIILYGRYYIVLQISCKAEVLSNDLPMDGSGE